MSDETGYIVIRPAPDLPAGFLPSHFDGLWVERSRRDAPSAQPGDFAAKGWGEGVAVATGRFEYADDGSAAEVYEVRP